MARLDDLGRWQRALLLGSVGVILLVVLALLAEGAVRARHWLKHGGMWGVEETYAPDPDTGLRVPVAGARAGGIEINSLGFRGPEIAVPKPGGTIRLAFVGASTTFSAEVRPNERTWPHRVWKRLSERYPEARFDYVNAGVPGYTLASSLEGLRRRLEPLDPDVVVIYQATNDLAKNSRRLALAQGLAAEAGDADPDWLSRHSLLWYLARKNARVLWRRFQARSGEPRLEVEPEVLAAPFRADLRALVRAARERAAIVALVTFSHRLRREQGPGERAEAAVTSLYYMPYMSIDGLLDGFEAYNRVIREVAAETGALLIEDEDTIPADGEHFADSVHFTASGSRVMAERVSAGLLAASAFQALVRARAAETHLR